MSFLALSRFSGVMMGVMVCLDGGSSSIMAYEGKIITKNSSKSTRGRTLPNAFVVSHPSK